MLVERSTLGFVLRSWRYSMLVNDGVIETAFVEDHFGDNCPLDPFEVSDADTMLNYLKGEPRPPSASLVTLSCSHAVMQLQSSTP
jgi:hypothetical protein